MGQLAHTAGLVFAALFISFLLAGCNVELLAGTFKIWDSTQSSVDPSSEIVLP